MKDSDAQSFSFTVSKRFQTSNWFDPKRTNRTGSGQCIGFIDHNIIMYIKIPCGDSGIQNDR